MIASRAVLPTQRAPKLVPDFSTQTLRMSLEVDMLPCGERCLGAREAASKEQKRDRRNHGGREKDENQSGEIPHFVHPVVPSEGKPKLCSARPLRAPAPRSAGSSRVSGSSLTRKGGDSSSDLRHALGVRRFRRRQCGAVQRVGRVT
jgi:hypothetical protein